MEKILFVIQQLGFGGAQRQLFYLLQKLDRSRYEPMLCVLEAGEVIPEFHSLRLPIIRLKRHLRRYDISRFFHLLGLIRQDRPHLLHAFLGVANFYAGLASLLTGIPLIISERNANPRPFPNVVDRWLAHLMVLRATRITANSQAGADLLCQRHGLAAERVRVIPNGVDPGPFDQPRDIHKTRLALGLRPEVATIGIIGTIDGARKDHATFLRAIKILKAQCPLDFQVVCVGGGPKLQETVSLARSLGVEGFTVFTGKRSDVVQIMPAVDLLVSSSRWEGLPNAIMEAMAARKPVVATAVGGTPELVVHGVTGLLVPPEDPATLAGAMVQLIRDQELARQMGQAGRRRLEQHFSIGEMVRRTEMMYQSLLSA